MSFINITFLVTWPKRKYYFNLDFIRIDLGQSININQWKPLKLTFQIVYYIKKKKKKNHK